MLLDRILALLGKRSDDPEILAFHTEQKLKKPKVATSTDVVYPVTHEESGYTLYYGAELRTLETWPPRRENGKYVSYLAFAEIERSFPLPDGLSTDLAEAIARERAVSSRTTEIHHVHRLVARGDRSLDALYLVNDGSLRAMRLVLDELDEDDPRLEELAAVARKQAKSKAPKRKFPKAKGKPEDVALPAALAELAALDLGEMDLELHERIEVGGPTAWLGNEDAEHELRVFAQDGSGGLVAFWIVDAGGALEAQPIVFLGSEGKTGVVATDLAAFFDLLATGVGPYEAIENGADEGEPLAAVRELAEKHFGKRRKVGVADVLGEAASAHPDFEDRVRALSKH
jgi:hypothetical protein